MRLCSRLNCFIKVCKKQINQKSILDDRGGYKRRSAAEDCLLVVAADYFGLDYNANWRIEGLFHALFDLPTVNLSASTIDAIQNNLRKWIYF